MSFDNYVSESEALNDWVDESDLHDWDHEEKEHKKYNNDLIKRVQTSINLHASNKAARVGDMITCCCGCNRKFKKRSYQQVFFNSKSGSGTSNCKDRYHNWVNDNRRFRMLAVSGELEKMNNYDDDSNHNIRMNMVLDMKADDIVADSLDSVRKDIISKLPNADEKTLKTILAVLSI